VTLHGGFVRVETDRGTLTARQVILATGRNDRRRIPPGVMDAVQADAEVRHALDPRRPLESFAGLRRVAILGGGMTAGHLAHAMCSEGIRVDIFTPHGMRVRYFDTDLRWAVSPRVRHRYFPRPEGPDNAASRCGYPGTVVPELAAELRDHLDGDRLRWHRVAVDRVTRGPGSAIVHAGPRTSGDFDRVILATGYQSAPLPAWMMTTAEDEGLELDARGYPILQRDLRWHPRLYVTGVAATPVLGPLAANIAGARLAAERIVNAVGVPA
jgi:pyruvate/2-oxoglutarate dehydrogenase complex dihydrolipoamide dehydrogenase (E3) component